MPAPFYLGWAVMAVLALGTADMLRLVAVNMFRGQHGASKTEEAKRCPPTPKALEKTARPEGMWF